MQLNLERKNVNIHEIMDLISIKDVSAWKALEGSHVPDKIDRACPWCDSWVTLNISEHVFVHTVQTYNMIATCPKCKNICRVWAVYKLNINNPTATFCEELWILPKRKTKETIPQSNLINTDVLDAYEEAIKLFNSTFWKACVTECGRALEALTEDKFQTKELRKQLKIISSKIVASDNENEIVKSILFEPVLKLSSAIRLGRLTGAHFRIKSKPNKDVAEKVLNLTEYLIKYFYILPVNAIELEEAIDALGDKGLTEEEDLYNI